jgi:hypothetical protein
MSATRTLVTSSTSASPTEFYATAAPTAVAGETRRIT